MTHLQLALHPLQQRVYDAAIDESHPQHVIAIWGRGAGKTTVARRIITGAVSGPNARDRLVVYVGPTVQQARRLIWEQLRDSIPTQFLRPGRLSPIQEHRMEIYLRNGCKIWVLGADSLGSQRGLSIYRLVIDEYQECDPMVWPTLRPSLRTRHDRAVVLGTPNGPDHFQELFRRAEKSEEWTAIRAPTWAAPHSDPANLREALSMMDRQSFDQEYGAEFLSVRGAIYKDFSRDRHCRVESPKPGRWWVGMDFNHSHYTSIIAQGDGDHVHVHAELIGRGTLADQSESMQRWFEARGVDWRRDVAIIGDASGAFNSTNTRTAGQSDSILIRQWGWDLKLERANPKVLDRVNSLQSLIRAANGTQRLSVDPGCEYLLKCLECQEWNRFGQPDKARGLDHATDALGYLAWHLRPIREIRRFRVA